MPPDQPRKGTPMTEAPILPLRPGSPLRTPRAAAVAGIIFSVLLITALVLLRLSVPAHPEVPGSWLTDSRSRTGIAVALNLVPFAGIAFLWFIGVLRDRIGAREDRFFATVFLGSGLIFVAMLFVAAAVAGGVIADASSSGPPGPDTLAFGRSITGALLNIYAMRMAAVFTLTTVTIARRTEIVSGWLTVAGLGSALVLLVGVGISPWVELLFPLWILALSVDILAAGLRKSPGSTEPARP
jgi:MFS family permease